MVLRLRTTPACAGSAGLPGKLLVLSANPFAAAIGQTRLVVDSHGGRMPRSDIAIVLDALEHLLNLAASVCHLSREHSGIRCMAIVLLMLGLGERMATFVSSEERTVTSVALMANFTAKQ